MCAPALPAEVDWAAMRRRLLLLAAFVLAGWAFGVLDSRIPMPSSSTVFWVGNLGSTWLVLPFLAGWAQRSRPWACLLYTSPSPRD